MIHLTNSVYDAVWKRNDDGEIVQALADVPDATKAASDNLVTVIQEFFPPDSSQITNLSLSDVSSTKELNKELN